MLARVANNLFWMGRYIERSEHIARYMCVNYFSSLDAPDELAQSRQFVLKSILFMVGDFDNEIDKEEELEEKDVFYNIGLNTDKQYSIISCVKQARENANSARDLISTELYEAINKFYHFVLNYSTEEYSKKGIYDFTTNCIEYSAILKAKIRTTLLRDEVYSIIKLGVNLERSMQVVRIISSKYHDILLIKLKHQDVLNEKQQTVVSEKEENILKRVQEQNLSNNIRSESETSDVNMEWCTLLKCVESYDMMRRFHKKTPNNINTLDFLILNPDCPRSVVNSLAEVAEHIQVLSSEKRVSKDSSIFLVNKIYAEYKYKYIEEIEVDFQTFIKNILTNLVAVSKKMEEEYFTY